MQSQALTAAVLLSFPRPPDHLDLPGTAPCSCRFCVRMYVCLLAWKGKGAPSSARLRSVGRVCVRVVLQIPGHFCVWVPPSAGLRFGRRKITNYKLQITTVLPTTTTLVLRATFFRSAGLSSSEHPALCFDIPRSLLGSPWKASTVLYSRCLDKCGRSFYFISLPQCVLSARSFFAR